MSANSSNQSPGPNCGFRTFEDLQVYKMAREFRKAMYRVARTLPDFEKFCLADQMRRAALSLTNNLAEGHGRYHFPEQIKFTLISRGSLEELIGDLNACFDENYLPMPEVERLKTEGWKLLRLVNGYLRYLRDRKLGNAMELRESTVSCGEADVEELLESLPPWAEDINLPSFKR